MSARLENAIRYSIENYEKGDSCVTMDEFLMAMEIMRLRGKLELAEDWRTGIATVCLCGHGWFACPIHAHATNDTSPRLNDHPLTVTIPPSARVTGGTEP